MQRQRVECREIVHNTRLYESTDGGMPCESLKAQVKEKQIHEYVGQIE